MISSKTWFADTLVFACIVKRSTGGIVFARAICTRSLGGKHVSIQLRGDENDISLYIINTCSNIQVMRIKKVMTKDMMS